MIRKKTSVASLTGLIVILFVLAFANKGCYYDNEEYLYPSFEKCDTSVFNYADGVSYVLESSCLSCHAANVADANGGGINLSSYATLKDFAESGILLGSIKHLNGYNPMPKGADKIEDCKITIIEKWISNGALNN